VSARTAWRRGSHEAAVERFYARGVHDRTDVHRGYLNFGLWEEGVDEYVRAAENLVARLGRLAGLGPGSRLLDVGCGFGTQDLYLLRSFGPLEIDGLDVTWSHVEGARRRAWREGVAERVRFHHGSATSLPFADASFTQLIGIEGPVHFLTRRRFFAEAARVLRPGGVMALADYSLVRRPANLLERGVFELGRALWKVPAENVCTGEEYREQLLQAGFEDVRVESVAELTFPGYYREQKRPGFRREMERLQGRLTARLGQIINVAAFGAYRLGVVDYLLVRAVRGSSPSSAAASRRSAVSKPSSKPA